MNPRPLSKDELSELRGSVSGEVTALEDAGFDEARAVWNAMIDSRPALIVRAANEGDIAPTIAFSRRHGLDLVARGGGHKRRVAAASSRAA